jgi:hypothetical protein
MTQQATAREASRKDHLPYEARHVDENPIDAGRFNMAQRRAVSEERSDL